MGDVRQITIISGKGGTGKTTLTASFGFLARGRAVLADCDVDAANLHLILKPEVMETIPFRGSKLAVIDHGKCVGCGECYRRCRFDAIAEDIEVVPELCEGCGVCALVCPADAITLKERDTGEAYISNTRFGPMTHARLFTAEEASGKLVTLVRNQAKMLAEKGGKEFVLVDGPPGIGCPVISAISGVDLVVVVTEPTLSGIHDMERVLSVAEHFRIRSVLVINKFDLNEENTRAIEERAEERGAPVLGKIPYDVSVVRSMVEGKSVIEYSPESPVSAEIERVWKKIEALVMGDTLTG